MGMDLSHSIVNSLVNGHAMPANGDGSTAQIPLFPPAPRPVDHKLRDGFDDVRAHNSGGAGGTSGSANDGSTGRSGNPTDGTKTQQRNSSVVTVIRDGLATAAGVMVGTVVSLGCNAVTRGTQTQTCAVAGAAAGGATASALK